MDDALTLAAWVAAHAPAHARINLRGWTVCVRCPDRRWRRVQVVTHIRGDRWLVVADGICLVVAESAMHAPEPPPATGGP